MKEDHGVTPHVVFMENEKVMEFDEVVTKSFDVASFNQNVRAYLEERPELSQEERSKHYWALFYTWRESMYASRKDNELDFDISR